MESTEAFTIVSKDLQNPNGTAITQYHNVEIRIQKGGSVFVPCIGVIGKNDFNAQLEAVVVQMKEGEKWTVADQEKVQYVIEVTKVGALVDGKTHLQKADSIKGQGNTFFKAKQYTKAIEKYQQAYNMVLNDPEPKAQELKLSLISNLAQANLNLSDFRQAIQWCSEHLQETLEPNLKIIYRRASANKGLRLWNQAKSDIQLGIQNSGDDAESVQNFKKLSLQLQRQYKQQKQKQKVVYGKMFG